MRFCGEVNDGAGFVGCEEVIEEGAVADIAVEKEVVWVAVEGEKIVGVTGIGEGIEVKDAALL